MADAPETLPTEGLFATELETFKTSLPELLKTNLGRYALVKGEAIDSVWDTQNDAIAVGYRTWGARDPFMVQPIVPLDLPVEITRITVPESNPHGL